MTNNPHETAARLLKVARLVAVIDAQVGERAFSKALHISRWIDGLTETGWQGLADLAGVRMPSQTTRSMVAAAYRDRAADSIVARSPFTKRAS